MEDRDNAVPVNIHDETCHEYQNRKINATTTVWHFAETLEAAELLARNLAKSKGCKRAGCCLDNFTLN